MQSRPSLSERKRAAILEAAIEEFHERGFDTVSMDAIAARASVSKRTVYNHFQSKDALFRAIVALLMRQASESAPIDYAADQPLNTQLADYARRKLALLASPRFRQLSRVLLSTIIHHPALADEAMTELQSPANGLEDWVNAAIAEGRLQPVDPGYAAEQFTALLKASAFWPQLILNAPVPDADTGARLIDDAVFMFLARHSTATKVE